ncbi:hypothetical protein VOI54_05355 [Tamlana sp. 2201CG12-4]|uniref:hypothetical protein n=1 Tax=Tamlana sp. 2201CG12-4 TaxID=3112582 RepID=UPI002DBBDD72|nr:hypothetical protein [Tamlana sp. 2201CG12-4]MEC3906434.1 hypothetical protein [Tamlana sp. 2201CG12-4]
MEKPKKQKDDNYWGYIIFAALILIYIPFGDDIWGASNPTSRTNRTNNRPIEQTEVNSQYNRNNTNKTNNVNYCSLSTNELLKQLTKERNYKLNGSGNVRFTDRFDHARDQWVESQIIITVNRKRLEGKWKLLVNNQISITDLMVTGGNFDASRNSRTRGMLVIDCNGNLKGMLLDPNGNRRDITISKSR